MEDAHTALDSAHPDMDFGNISGYTDEMQRKKVQAWKTSMVIIILALSNFDFF